MIVCQSLLHQCPDDIVIRDLLVTEGWNLHVLKTIKCFATKSANLTNNNVNIYKIVCLEKNR